MISPLPSFFIPVYISQYPPAQNSTYVKATTEISSSYYAYFATDPTKSLIGPSGDNSWLSGYDIITNQRFHIDLGVAKTIKRIYYENFHWGNGQILIVGVKNFTFWGSNNPAAFAELTYGIDTNWTQLTTAQSTFDIHKVENEADPKYILVTNTTAYRYYAFKFADNHGSAEYMGVRRIELQIEG